MATAVAKLEYCEVCAGQKAKYTCPKCEVRTCSLTCINIHKKELDCDGVRNKTKFIPMNSFTELDLLSDYRLLEEIGKSVETMKKNMEQKKIVSRVHLPVHLYKLKSAAFKKHVRLLLMPQIFSRHKENTTFLDWKTNELFWRIEWIFPQAQNAKCVMERVLDNIRLSKLVEQVLDPISTCKGETNIEVLNTKLALSDKLQFYRASGISNIQILLKAEKMKSKFYNLDITLSLKENLEHKTIIEYPTFYVIMKDHSSMFDVIDSDEEPEIRDYNNRKAQKRKNSNDNDEKGKSKENVNFFFDDFSESDDEKVDKNAQGNKSVLNIPYYENLIKNSDNK